MKKRGQKGGVVILALLGLGLFMLGAIGLAIDTSYLYSHRQMAQVAADSAAQAAIMSVFDKTNVDDGTCDNAFGSSAFSCTANSDCRTPCRFARYNGFGVGADDVYVEFPKTVDGVSKLSTRDNPPVVRVTVTRAVQTWLTRMVGAAATSNVRVQATAAIVDADAPVPIIVLHPYLQKSFTVTGSSGIIKICGGAARSIQVNSCAGSGGKIRVTTPSGTYIEDCQTAIESTAFNGNQGVDLSQAGPKDPGNCTTGTGGDFGNFGLPLPPAPANLNLGTAGRYLDPASPIPDPFIDVPPPAQPLNSLTAGLGPQPAGNGGAGGGIPLTGNPVGLTVGCPDLVTTCNLYLPGYYPYGFQAKLETALMAPGIYYMGSNGFANDTQGNMKMALCNLNIPPIATFSATNTNLTTDTDCGMLVYNTGSGDGFQIGASGSANIFGPPDSSVYQGILFFNDRNLTLAQTKKPHKVGGSGSVGLTGAIYLVNSDKINNPQGLTLAGSGASGTSLSGGIVVDLLTLNGGSSIIMKLNPSGRIVRKVALVR